MSVAPAAGKPPAGRICEGADTIPQVNEPTLDEWLRGVTEALTALATSQELLLIRLRQIGLNTRSRTNGAVGSKTAIRQPGILQRPSRPITRI
jgi:hypothetical protein